MEPVSATSRLVAADDGLSVPRNVVWTPSIIAPEGKSASPKSATSPVTSAAPAAEPVSASPAASSTTPPPALALSAPSATSAPFATNASALSATALDPIVDQIADAREAGRGLRPELTVRTGEFGAVSVRLDTSAGASVNDWRATLVARDPGFLPAVQAALADRSIAAASETAMAQNGGFSQRGQDQSSGSSQSNAGFGAGSGGGAQSHQSERYGSSTGSDQGPAKPYSGEESDSGSKRAAADTRDIVVDPSQGPGGARFA
ncbi:MAG: hypothetical protein AAF291_08410 [Pseudomonadota bacterium]